MMFVGYMVIRGRVISRVLNPIQWRHSLRHFDVLSVNQSNTSGFALPSSPVWDGSQNVDGHRLGIYCSLGT